MNWLQLLLMILNLLRDLKQAGSKEEFAATASAQRVQARGDLLKWLWENRQMLLDLLELIMGRIGQPQPPHAGVLSSNPDRLNHELEQAVSDLREGTAQALSGPAAQDDSDAPAPNPEPETEGYVTPKPEGTAVDDAPQEPNA